MRLPAAASALFPLAGEEKKSKSEAEHHRLHSVTPAARARSTTATRSQAATIGGSREYGVALPSLVGERALVEGDTVGDLQVDAVAGSDLGFGVGISLGWRHTPDVRSPADRGPEELPFEVRLGIQ
jgi:hypothetical protein